MIVRYLVQYIVLFPCEHTCCCTFSQRTCILGIQSYYDAVAPVVDNGSKRADNQLSTAGRLHKELCRFVDSSRQSNQTMSAATRVKLSRRGGRFEGNAIDIIHHILNFGHAHDGVVRGCITARSIGMSSHSTRRHAGVLGSS
jgi:hypothetical protein